MAITSSLSRLFNQEGSTKAPTGTGYTNLNRFLGANQGNQLGAQVSGNLQNQIGTVQNQLQDQKTTFEQNAEKSRLDSTQNAAARDSIIGRFSSPSTAGGQLSTEDVNKVTQFRGGQYAGPSGLQDTTALSQQANDLASQTGNLSSSGTQELLRRTIGGGRYTQGQQRLDSILMDRSGLRQVGREAQALGSDVNRANLAAQGQAQALAGQAKQFGAETTAQLQGALGGLDTAAQAQLSTAQAAEQQRLANIAAIQDFTRGKTVARDASGNPILDQYGRETYDTTTNPRGSNDAYTQIDQLREMLLSRGANVDEVNTVLGGGDQSKTKAAYDAAQEQARKDYLLGNNAAILGNAQVLRDAGYMDRNNIFGLGEDGDALNSASGRLRDDLTSGRIKASDLTGINYGNYTYNGGGDGYSNNAYSQAMAEAEKLYSPKGLAGRALNAGNLEQFYGNLGNTLGQSAAAQGLTQQGVASDEIRNNYTALQQLLGNTADLNKYGTNDQRYEAGKFLLDPERLARTL